jgi:hypothetical protein
LGACPPCGGGPPACRRAGHLARRIKRSQRSSPGYSGNRGKVVRFDPGGRMPPSTSGGTPDATPPVPPRTERRFLPRRLVAPNPAMREKAEASACPPKPGEGWKRKLVRPGVFTDNELRAESEFGVPRQYQAAPPVSGLLKKAFFRSSRGHEAQISLETIIRLAPSHQSSHQVLRPGRHRLLLLQRAASRRSRNPGSS